MIETINYVIHLNNDPDMIRKSCNILGRFLESTDTNLRYLALETMAHIAAAGDPLETLPSHQNTVLKALKDKDISICRRALDLLYSMCKSDNAREIVDKLLEYLSDADYEFQEELVLKIAILSEKFVSEYTWYVDVILKLITTAGDAASDSLWYRVVQIVTNHQDLREYAAYTLLQAVRQPQCHEITLRIAGHILGEFGHVIVESPNCSPLDQFMAFQSKFPMSTPATRAILLSTYLKFTNLFPEIKGEIIKVFESYQYVLDIEIQQRACEYLAIVRLEDDRLLQAVCEEMPAFSERESTLLSQLSKKVNDTEDIRIWNIGGVDAQVALAHRRSESKQTVVANVMNDKSDTPNAQPIIDLSQNIVEEPQNVHTIPEDQIVMWFNHLLISRTGILYEDNSIQIGIKSDYQNNLGRLSVYVGNKSAFPFTNFTISHSISDSLNIIISENISSNIPASAQLYQMYNIEAVGIPAEAPFIRISYQLQNQQISKQLQLPIILTKFITGCILSSNDFFARWKQIGEPEKETQIAFGAIGEIDIDRTRIAISGLGLSLLEAIDPNPDNSIFAGIFASTNTGKVGCLLRLEVNQQHKVLLFN